MSVESLAAVLHHSRAKGTVKLVLVGIANHDGDGGSYPAVSTLARYANVEPRNVQRALEKLVSLGELAVFLREGGTPRTPDHERTNRYEVLVSCPPWCDRTTQHRDTRASRQANLRGLSTGLSTDSTGLSTTPRRRRHPLTLAPGAPLAETSPEPSIEPTHPNPVGTQAQYAHAVCKVCSQDHDTCASRQRRLSAQDRHTFEASRAQG